MQEQKPVRFFEHHLAELCHSDPPVINPGIAYFTGYGFVGVQTVGVLACTAMARIP